MSTNVVPSATTTVDLKPIRPEHPRGLAAVLQETEHINHPNAQGRVEAQACEMKLLTLFLTMANADVPEPPSGHVKAAGFAETPIPLEQLMMAGHKAHQAKQNRTSDAETMKSTAKVVSTMKVPGL